MVKGIGSITPFGLRMPSDVKKWVSDRAHENDRSMNTEIVRILRDRMQTATGVKFGDPAPAAAPNEPSGIGSSTHGL